MNPKRVETETNVCKILDRDMKVHHATKKKEALLQEKKDKLNRNFEKVKQKALEMQRLREYQSKVLLNSLALAEANRNLHIEKRRAASKKTVEKAKKVVLLNQRKTKEEQEKRRAELENRIQKTEARRLAHLNRYKKKATESKKSALAGSRLLSHFCHLGLPLMSQPNTWLPFAAASQLIHQAKVLIVTDKMLNLALKQQDSHRKRARIFLTAYMFTMCPDDIFERQGKEEKDLSESAKRLLSIFETWQSTYGRTGASHARYECVKSWSEYTVLFDQWKNKDREELLESTTAYYLQLFRLQQTIVQHDQAAAEQLQKQLDHIQRQLNKLGGKRALEELRLSREKIRLESSSQETGANETTGGEEHEETGRQGSVYRVLDCYADSPLDHMQLAHELILNPEFDYKDYRKPSALEAQIKAVAQKAYFDQAQQEISETGMSLERLKELRERLVRLVPRKRNQLSDKIDQVMDMAWIEQRLRQKTLDVHSLMGSVLTLLSEMCAPIRDSEIRQIRKVPVAGQWEQVHKLCDRMELDLACVALRAVRIPLMKIAVAYERARFAELVDRGPVTLVRTRAWLQEVCVRLCEVATTRHPESLLPGRPAIFEEAWVALIHPPMSPDQWPESLMLDRARLLGFQKEAERITSVAALLMLARNLGRANNAALARLSLKLLTMLQDASSVEHLTAEIERSLGQSLPQERKALIKSMVLKTLSHSDTVYSLLSRRVASVIKSTLQNKRFVTNAVMVSNGLEHVHGPLQSLSQQVFQLAQHHRQIYAPWYDEIIQESLSQP